MLPVSKVAEPSFRENVLDRMANDKFSLIARNDNASYGQRMYKKYGKNRHQHQLPAVVPVKSLLKLHKTDILKCLL